MTDLRQAAQQALEALEAYKGFIDDAHIIEGQWHWLDGSDNAITALKAALEQQAEPVSMRMPKVGDKVICLEDESLGEVVSLTAGGSPDITFDDGTRGTYLLREFAELFGYVAPPQQQAEPPQRQWVGLTDEEIEAVVEQVANGKLVGTVQEFRIRFSRAIEAKLKEKNT